MAKKGRRTRRTDEAKRHPRHERVRKGETKLELLGEGDQALLRLETALRRLDTVERDGVELEGVAVGEDCSRKGAGEVSAVEEEAEGGREEKKRRDRRRTAKHLVRRFNTSDTGSLRRVEEGVDDLTERRDRMRRRKARKWEEKERKRSESVAK